MKLLHKQNIKGEIFKTGSAWSSDIVWTDFGSETGIFYQSSNRNRWYRENGPDTTFSYVLQILSEDICIYFVNYCSCSCKGYRFYTSEGVLAGQVSTGKIPKWRSCFGGNWVFKIISRYIGSFTSNATNKKALGRNRNHSYKL